MTTFDPRNTWRFFVARFDSGECASCNTPILTGQEMLYRKADNKKHHAACPITRTFLTDVEVKRLNETALSVIDNSPAQQNPETSFQKMLREYHDEQAIEAATQTAKEAREALDAKEAELTEYCISVEQGAPNHSSSFKPKTAKRSRKHTEPA